jgi:hypothetical protein
MAGHVFAVFEQRRVLGKFLGHARVSAQELSKAVLFTIHAAAGHAILAALVTVFLLHEGIGILVQLLTHALVVLKIGLQRGVVLHKLLVFRQCRIAAKLLGDFPVFVEELIEAHYLTVVTVAVTTVLAIVVVLPVIVAIIGIAIPNVLPVIVGLPIIVIAAIVVASARVIAVVVPASIVAIEVTITSLGFVVVVAILLPHEGIRILIQPLLDVGMLLQIGLQRWMGFEELLIFYLRRIATKLFGGFAVSVEEAIKLRHLSTAVIVSPVHVTPVHVTPV